MALEFGGQKIDREELKGRAYEMKISGTRYESKNKEGPTVSGSFQIDESKRPARWEETDDNGVMKGKTRLGVFRLDTDRLIICDAQPDEPRPGEFETKGSNRVMARMRG